MNNYKLLGDQAYALTNGCGIDYCPSKEEVDERYQKRSELTVESETIRFM